MDKYNYALGRRKTAVATVRLHKGTGDNMINGKKMTEIYTTLRRQEKITMPFRVTNTGDQFYFTAQAKGGGITGQLDAIVLGLSRALVKEDEAYKAELKKNKLLSRDERAVERKKTGLRKARKAPQFSKR